MYHIQQNLNKLFENYNLYEPSLTSIQYKFQTQLIHNLSFSRNDVIKNILKKQNQSSSIQITSTSVDNIILCENKKKNDNFEILK